jgi:hypothetical protein
MGLFGPSKAEKASSARITASIQQETARNTRQTADEERRANPRPHKVDKSVLRVKEGRGRR